MPNINSNNGVVTPPPTRNFEQYLETQGGATLATSLRSFYRGALDVNNVDNTSDADKPVSTLTQTALDDKMDTDGANAALPTVDPVADGALWSDTLAVKVSDAP